MAAFDQSMLEALSRLRVAKCLPPLFIGWARCSSCLTTCFHNLYIGSLDQSWSLVDRILGFIPDSSVHLGTALTDLAVASGSDDRTSIEEVDVPLTSELFLGL